MSLFWQRKRNELNDGLDSHLRMSSDERVARGEKS